MNSIKRRTAIETGGATGIGRAITMRLFNDDDFISTVSKS